MHTLDAFIAAQQRIAPHVLTTPVSYHSPLNLHFKWENQQHTGAFKPRGAINKILNLPQSAQAAGLVAASAGNHGLGVALAAQMTNSRATIFVPENAPRIKVEKIQALGASVQQVAGGYRIAEQHAYAFAAETGATYVSPYNDPDVVAGAGTIALEWLVQSPHLECWLIPLGGGGLMAGMGRVARLLKPNLIVLGVQSEASAYLFHQYYYGHMRNVTESATLTDGLAGDVEQGITTQWLAHVCDGVVLVTESEVAAAIAYAYHELGQVVEGSGAVGLAAVLAGKVHPQEKATGTLISGGNIDPERLAALI